MGKERTKRPKEEGGESDFVLHKKSGSISLTIGNIGKFRQKETAPKGGLSSERTSSEL
jgi:hypothetical protein